MTADHPGSPLEGIVYSQRAYDLSRFVDDPTDDAIATIVRAAKNLSPDERDTLRMRLDEHDCDTILAFSQRRAASGIRKGSLAEALDAVEAGTLITATKVDPRDLHVDFPLYAVRRLGGDVSRTVKAAAAASERGTRGFIKAHGAPTALKGCLLLEVTSRYGLGFMRMLSQRYAPQTDVAALAIRLADAIDAAGRYVVDSLHVSSLPAFWFDNAERSTREIRSTGCVSVHASTEGGSPWGHSLLVFVAEVDSATTASSLVEQAEAHSTDIRPRVASSDGRLMLLVIGGPSSFGPVTLETTESLRPIRDELRRVLRA